MTLEELKILPEEEIKRMMMDRFKKIFYHYTGPVERNISAAAQVVEADNATDYSQIQNWLSLGYSLYREKLIQ